MPSSFVLVLDYSSTMNKLCLALLLVGCVALVTMPQVAAVTCPVGYSANGNICYKYHKSCYTWEKASEACVKTGGFLYKIADDESYQLINSLVDGNGLCDHGVWVGSRREADGSLKWRDNTLTDLNKFWSGGQPDGPNNGESCVEIRNAFGNLMNDRQCWIEKGFVCQAQPFVTCPVGYSANGNICYNYHKSCYTWEKASEACVKTGGFLYKIANDESYQLINSLVDGNGLCDHGVWVGSRREADGSLKWRDNTLTDLNKFWSGGQPDGPNNGESCVEIRNAFGNLMNDRQCWMEKGFVCQAQPILTCPVGYSANGTICYKYHKSCYTWENASEACVKTGGFLYKIADDESYQLINSLVDGNGLCDHGVWVGSRREADGSLKWRDNTLTDLNKFWSGGQPDGPNNGESCVEIRNAFGNLMNDRQCWIEKGFVCQARLHRKP